MSSVSLYVTDTHSLLWYLGGSPKLSSKAKQAFDEAHAGRAKIIVPIILTQIPEMHDRLIACEGPALEGKIDHRRCSVKIWPGLLRWCGDFHQTELPKGKFRSARNWG